MKTRASVRTAKMLACALVLCSGGAAADDPPAQASMPPPATMADSDDSASADITSSFARSLTLVQAQQMALQNNPDLQSVGRSIEIARAAITEARAAYFPQISGAITAVGAQATDYKSGNHALEPRITAGALNEPTVEDRTAAGVSVTQLVTDFGRTGNLVDSAKAHLDAANASLEDQRQLLLLAVTQQYLQALEGQGTLQVARSTLADRVTLRDRVVLLQQNQLKSDLDLSFASVDVDQAQLLVVQTQAQAQIEIAALESTLGIGDAHPLKLVEPEHELAAPPASVDATIRSALADRPELQRLRSDLKAAQEYASAQHKLQAPTLNLIGAAGVTASGDSNLPRDYAAGGLNLSIPIFQGGRLQSQYEQADLRAQQAEDAVHGAELAAAYEVRSAWLRARSAFAAIEVSDHLQASASSALELAQARYRLGVSSIVELNRAEHSQIDAQIGDVAARYEYRIALARLAYSSGTLSPCSTSQDTCR